ncbi:deacetylase sulfotransferase [Catellatospora sp. TT07R-123]|uniref:sulfotransferase domain-containing protein n=1 Tax=Catellatospora sp. TT07R-123 TaxID=2733863 RepID=UPI001B217459|nr:sulfotransferase domain-containing protein [Catellatospora sp. TT07R-123]GHJ46408.1 deacetylase sulfotransferase [Catellatospora sp. TT07R-123]
MATSRVRKILSHQAGVLARSAGRLTADRRMTPSFLIVGTQRGGTTSLHKALVQHPSFLPARFRKGVHYFDMDYQRGHRWFQGHFPSRSKAARLEQASGHRVITGEASPYYMWHPLAPERIARDLPGVKLIVLLRDPVGRAYSGWSHEYARGFETETFERAVELEPQRMAGERERMKADPSYHSHAVRHLAHLGRGEYIDQLLHLESLVGRERLLVIDSEDYFAEPQPAFAEVCRFLDIPDVAGIVHDQHNARSRTPMSDELKQRLEEHFRPYDERLAAWLGRTPSWRR